MCSMLQLLHQRAMLHLQVDTKASTIVVEGVGLATEGDFIITAAAAAAIITIVTWLVG